MQNVRSCLEGSHVKLKFLHWVTPGHFSADVIKFTLGSTLNFDADVKKGPRVTDVKTASLVPDLAFKIYILCALRYHILCGKRFVSHALG